MNKVKLNIGSGIDKKEGFIGVDLLPDADIQLNIETDKWLWEEESVDEILAEHVVEHLESLSKFLNNCWHILKKGCTLTITTPHPLYEWYWQDPTHIHGYTSNTFSIYCTGHPKTKHCNIIPWSNVEVSERVFRTNNIQACEIKAILTK